MALPAQPVPPVPPGQPGQPAGSAPPPPEPAAPDRPPAPNGARRRPLSRSATAGYAAAAAAGVAVFAVSSVEARRGRVVPREHAVFRQVNTLPDRLHPPVWAVMQAGSLGAVGAAAAAAWAARRHATAVGLGATGFTMWAGAKVVKRGVRRGRPRAHVPSVNIRGAEARGLGFPSGHAAVSFALATVAAPALPRAARPVPWAVALAASTARMYVGAHLPLDVLGGAALGVAAGALTNVAIGDRTPHG